MDQESYLDRILSRFSYTTKMRFILSVGYFPVLFALIVNFYLIFRPLQNIQEQQEGLDYLQRLGSISEKIQTYFMQPKETLEISIDKSLNDFTQKINEWMQSKIDDELVWKNFNIQLLLFNEYWNQLKKEQNVLTFHGFYTVYLTLIDQISFVSQLTFNVDTGVAYLRRALCRDLPNIQKGLTLVLLNTLAMQKERHLIEDLESSSRHFLEKGLFAINNLTPWIDGDIQVSVSDLQRFATGVEEYSFLAEMPLNETSYESVLLELTSYQRDLLKTSFKLNRQLQSLLSNALIAEKKAFSEILLKCLLLLMLGSSLVAIFYLTRLIRYPLENLVFAAQEFSKGNVEIRVPITAKDEVALISEAFNQAVDYFESVLKKVSTVIHQIFVTATSISSYTKEFESNMNMQERVVRQISSHAKKFQKSEEEFIEVLQSANKAASQTGTLAEIGHRSLHEMESIMHEMLSVSSNVVATLSSLQAKLGNIHLVIFTIVKIADQSNLLSLNTVIRATKSGSEGRGFVIIADKIREMAEQIAFATLDIEKVVEEIIKGVQVTVQEVEKFSSQILTQVNETTDIGNQLKQLIYATQEQVTEFENINDGMQDQTKGIIAINQVIEELRIHVQESAFAVRKLYLEIEYLYDSSYALQDTIKKFSS